VGVVGCLACWPAGRGSLIECTLLSLATSRLTLQGAGRCAKQLDGIPRSQASFQRAKRALPKHAPSWACKERPSTFVPLVVVRPMDALCGIQGHLPVFTAKEHACTLMPHHQMCGAHPQPAQGSKMAGKSVRSAGAACQCLHAHAVPCEVVLIHETRIAPLQGSKMAGKCVQSAGLRGMPGLFLVYIDKEDGTQMHAVAPDYVLEVS